MRERERERITLKKEATPGLDQVVTNGYIVVLNSNYYGTDKYFSLSVIERYAIVKMMLSDVVSIKKSDINFMKNVEKVIYENIKPLPKDTKIEK